MSTTVVILKMTPPSIHYRLCSIGDISGPILAHETFNKENKKTMKYYVFKSYKSLNKWYRKLAPGERRFHEIIRDGPQKFKLDMESPSSAMSSSEWNLSVSIIIDMASEAMNTVDYLRYRSHDRKGEKLSEHVIFHKNHLDGVLSCKLLLNDIMKMVKVYCKLRSIPDACKIIDTGVYKKNQPFRIEGSCKTKSDRYKYLEGYHDISPFFLNGLVKNIDPDSTLVIPVSRFLNPDWFRNNMSSGQFRSKYTK